MTRSAFAVRSARMCRSAVCDRRSPAPCAVIEDYRRKAKTWAADRSSPQVVKIGQAERRAMTSARLREVSFREENKLR